TVLHDQSVVATSSAPAFAFTPDDNGAYTVTLVVADQDGATGTATLDLPVANVAPSPVILLPAGTPAEGTPVALLSTVSDPSPVDTAAGLALAWSVTKNGQPFALSPGTV